MWKKISCRAALVATLAAAMASGCSTTAAGSRPELAGTSWLAEDIAAQGVIDNLQTTLSFESENRVVGNAGCNRYFGSVLIDADKLEFGPLGSTMMACPEAVMNQEQRFLAALESSRGYRLDNQTGLLYFTDQAGQDVLRFSRLEP